MKQSMPQPKLFYILGFVVLILGDMTALFFGAQAGSLVFKAIAVVFMALQTTGLLISRLLDKQTGRKTSRWKTAITVCFLFAIAVFLLTGMFRAVSLLFNK